MRKMGLLLLVCLAAALFCGCSSNAAQTRAAVAQGVAFQAGGEGYILSEVVRLPDYDTADQQVYGVVVLMKSNTAPVSAASGNGSLSAKSLIALSLDNGTGGVYNYADISFSLNESGYAYKSLAWFSFTLPKSVSFPEEGTFLYLGDPEEKVALSFKNIKIAEVSDLSSVTASSVMPSSQPLAEDAADAVSAADQLKAAAEDTAAKMTYITSDIEIVDEYMMERADDLELCLDDDTSL